MEYSGGDLTHLWGWPIPKGVTFVAIQKNNVTGAVRYFWTHDRKKYSYEFSPGTSKREQAATFVAVTRLGGKPEN